MTRDRDALDAIITNLRALEELRMGEGQPFRARAYATAARNLAYLRATGRTVTTLRDLDGVPGIGKGISGKIAEILAHGHTSETKGLPLELMAVPGVGLQTAMRLVKFGVRDVRALRRRPDLLTPQQRAGLLYMRDLSGRIPRAEVAEHESYLRKVLPETEFHVAGSYRRGEASSGDIDVLLVGGGLDKVLRLLRCKGYIGTVLSRGGRFATCVVRLPGHKWRQLDLLDTDRAALPFALLHFTAGRGANIALRALAHKKGMLLNDRGLWDLRTRRAIRADIRSEADIVRFVRSYPVSTRAGA